MVFYERLSFAASQNSARPKTSGSMLYDSLMIPSDPKSSTQIRPKRVQAMFRWFDIALHIIINEHHWDNLSIIETIDPSLRRFSRKYATNKHQKLPFMWSVQLTHTHTPLWLNTAVWPPTKWQHHPCMYSERLKRWNKHMLVITSKHHGKPGKETCPLESGDGMLDFFASHRVLAHQDAAPGRMLVIRRSPWYASCSIWLPPSSRQTQLNCYLLASTQYSTMWHVTIYELTILQ